MTGAPALSGIDHLKIAVSDLAGSLRWYERVLGGARVPEWDHRAPDGRLFASILRIPGVPIAVELRLEPSIAARTRGFDPIVLAAATLADLERWAAFLDDEGIANSGVLRGVIGWLIVFHDPDGLSVRIYSDESHALDPDQADFDSPWIAYS